jgi:hypothetical protein
MVELVHRDSIDKVQNKYNKKVLKNQINNLQMQQITYNTVTGQKEKQSMNFINIIRKLEDYQIIQAKFIKKLGTTLDLQGIGIKGKS